MDGRGREPFVPEPAEFLRGADGGLAQGSIKGNDLPAFRGVVEERAFRYLDVEHLFQRHGLRAELDLIGQAVMAATALVFDRVGLRMKLDDVGHAIDPEPVGDQRQGARDPVAFFGAGGGVIHPFVQVPAFEGEPVFRENAFDVNQRALARAEYDVLQAGQWQQFEVGGLRFQT